MNALLSGTGRRGQGRVAAALGVLTGRDHHRGRPTRPGISKRLQSSASTPPTRVGGCWPERDPRLLIAFDLLAHRGARTTTRACRCDERRTAVRTTRLAGGRRSTSRLRPQIWRRPRRWSPSFRGAPGPSTGVRSPSADDHLPADKGSCSKNSFKAVRTADAWVQRATVHSRATRGGAIGSARCSSALLRKGGSTWPFRRRHRRIPNGRAASTVSPRMAALVNRLFRRVHPWNWGRAHTPARAGPPRKRKERGLSVGNAGKKPVGHHRCGRRRSSRSATTHMEGHVSATPPSSTLAPDGAPASDGVRRRLATPLHLSPDGHRPRGCTTEEFLGPQPPVDVRCCGLTHPPRRTHAAIRSGFWEMGRVDTAYRLTTHRHPWTVAPPPAGKTSCFYGPHPKPTADFDDRGSPRRKWAHHYICRTVTKRGPMLRRVKERFGGRAACTPVAAMSRSGQTTHDR